MKRLILPYLLLTLLVVTTSSWAFAGLSERERIGQTYPIVEPDFLEEIKEKGAAVDWEKVFDKEKWEKKIKDFQPQNLSLLKKTVEPRMRFIDMTYTLDRAILDAKGQVLYPEGYQYNPMDYLPVAANVPMMLVIDGRDDDQVEWYMKSEYFNQYNVKLLLAGGHWYNVAEKIGHNVFYLMDPITERFDLEYAPCIIKRAGNMMVVDEFTISTEPTDDQS